ncbi:MULTISPECIES: MFS transporter [Brevibacterium]|nr:MFS transporter [Brevibacterium casei]
MVKEAQTARFAVAGLIMVALLAAAAAPSPLYPVYQQLWGFSDFTLTVIFAIYVLALLATMIALGSLADVVGTRSVLVAGLLVQIAAMVLFILADGVGPLIVARLVQGAATGLCTGAASAMIVAHQPSQPAGALVSGGSSPIGLALGAALAGLLVEYAPWPRQLVYSVLLGTYAALLIALILLPRDPVPRQPVRLRALVPRVGLPAAVRPLFIRRIPALLAIWAPAGLYLSLGASLVHTTFGVDNTFVVGLTLAVFFLPAPAATWRMRGMTPRRHGLLSFGLLGLGVLCTVVAVLVDSLALYIVASALAGAGFGAGFSRVMGTIGQAAPAADRSRTFATTFIVAYTAFSVPAVLAGLAAQHFGLVPTFIVYGLCEVGVVIIAAALAATSPKRGAPS